MTRVDLTGSEIHALRRVVREAAAQHEGDTPADAVWRRREGKLLERAVEKMTAANTADVDAVLRKVRLK